MNNSPTLTPEQRIVRALEQRLTPQDRVIYEWIFSGVDPCNLQDCRVFLERILSEESQGLSEQERWSRFTQSDDLVGELLGTEFISHPLDKECLIPVNRDTMPLASHEEAKTEAKKRYDSLSGRSELPPKIHFRNAERLAQALEGSAVSRLIDTFSKLSFPDVAVSIVAAEELVLRTEKLRASPDNVMNARRNRPTTAPHKTIIRRPASSRLLLFAALQKAQRPLTHGAIANEAGVPHRTAQKPLQKMRDDALIEVKEMGWVLTPKGKEVAKKELKKMGSFGLAGTQVAYLCVEQGM